MCTQAGVCKLHVWCDPQSKDERIAFPGSPFHLIVSPGAASTSISKVNGWTKVSIYTRPPKRHFMHLYIHEMPRWCSLGRFYMPPIAMHGVAATANAGTKGGEEHF